MCVKLYTRECNKLERITGGSKTTITCGLSSKQTFPPFKILYTLHEYGELSQSFFSSSNVTYIQKRATLLANACICIVFVRYSKERIYVAFWPNDSEGQSRISSFDLYVFRIRKGRWQNGPVRTKLYWGKSDRLRTTSCLQTNNSRNSISYLFFSPLRSWRTRYSKKNTRMKHEECTRIWKKIM